MIIVESVSPKGALNSNKHFDFYKFCFVWEKSNTKIIMAELGDDRIIQRIFFFAINIYVPFIKYSFEGDSLKSIQSIIMLICEM